MSVPWSPCSPVVTALLVGVPGLAKTKLVDTMGTALGLDARRIQFTPDLMPSDILGTEVLEESPGGKRSFRFIAGPVFAQLLMADEINRASPRTQSALLQAMQEQHVTVAGARHDLPKPFHVLATQNPLEQEGTYPLPEAQLDRFLMEIDVDYPDQEAERRILFDTTGADETRAKAAMTRRRLDGSAAPGPPPAGRRVGGRGDPGACALRAAWSRSGRNRQAHLLGPRPARKPGLDAGRARTRASGRPLRAVGRRRARTGRARAQASHGPDLRRARGRRNHPQCDPAAEGAHRIVAMAESRPNDIETSAVRQATVGARKLADAMPRLILEARRVASTVIHGLHGRRRAGPGENFWQYRRFVSGEPAQNVDWRRSARDDHLYVREREWEASHTVWIWPDRSPSMSFPSVLSNDSKLERGLVISFALAEVLVQGGERVGIPGLMRPTASRNVIEKMAEAFLHDPTERASLPPSFVPSPLSEIVMLSDLWAPIGEVRNTIAQLSATGAHGHVVQVVDPAEESFPYSGRVEFIEPEGAGSVTAGRAETWRNDYQGIVERHRAAIRAETDLRGWSFAIHRTDRPASELLLVLHSRMGDNAQPNLVNSRYAPASPASAA